MNRITFNGFTFPYNPETYESVVEKKIAYFPIYGAAEQVQLIGNTPRKISGTGAYVGRSADLFRTTLERLFLMNRSAVLKLPHGETFNAYFSFLKMVGDGKSGLLRYEFRFVEDTDVGNGVTG